MRRRSVGEPGGRAAAKAARPGATTRSGGLGRLPGAVAIVLSALVPSLLGCGSDSLEVDAAGGPISGGQTGSLVPGCEVAPGAQGQRVPAGDILTVLHGNDCLVALGRRHSLQAVGPEGTEVPVSLRILEESPGVFLVRSESGLRPGGYTLRAPLGVDAEVAQRELVVGEVSGLPGELGELTASPSPLSSLPPNFELALSEEARAYMPLLRLSARVDDGDAFVWSDYGSLVLLDAPLEGGAPPEGGFAGNSDRGQAARPRIRLTLPNCQPDCLNPGEHTLEVWGDVAGEMGETQRITTRFVLESLEEGASCTLARPGLLGAGGTLWGGAGWLVLAVLCGYRRIGELWRRSAARLANKHPTAPPQADFCNPRSVVRIERRLRLASCEPRSASARRD